MTSRRIKVNFSTSNQKLPLKFSHVFHFDSLNFNLVIFQQIKNK